MSIETDTVRCVTGDQVTWTALVAADPSGLAAIYDRHARAVYNMAFRRTASWSVAEEVVQQVFTALWRRATEGSLTELTRDTALPYLFTMTAHECANVSRSQRRLRALHERVARPTDVADHADSVVQRIDDEQRMSDVRRALRRLSRGQRETLELVVWAGLSIADAAETLGVSEGTVKSRLSRGRVRLGELLTTPDAIEEEVQP